MSNLGILTLVLNLNGPVLLIGIGVYYLRWSDLYRPDLHSNEGDSPIESEQEEILL